MAWIGRTLRSISVSGSSAIRFLADGTKNPEAKRFHEMVRDLDRNGTIDPCIDYFIEHFGSYEMSVLDELRINKEVTYVMMQFIPIFVENTNNFNEKNSLNRGFLFFEKAIFVYVPDQKTMLILYNFINCILETNKEDVLSRAMVFISKCLSISNLAFFFYNSCDSLINLWQTCFVKNAMTCQFYSPIFTATAEGIQFKNSDIFKPFFSAVNESFKMLQISNATALNAINFVAVISSKVNSNSFFTDFFVVSILFFINLPNLNSFSKFLNCRTLDPSSPWNGLNEICKNEHTSIQLLESAIEVVHDFVNSPLVVKFSLTPFVKRAKELDFETQKKMFDIIDVYPLSSKLDFYALSMPPWETGINSSLMCIMVKKNNWSRYSSVMLSTLALKPDYLTYKEKLISDEAITEITRCLIDNTSNKEEVSMILYREFIKLAFEGVDVAIHVIKKFTENENVGIYVEQFIGVLQEKLVCDAVFEIYVHLARKNLIFTISFLENDGISALFPVLKSDASLNFLASLASNGPYDAIDDYISKHIEGTDLIKTLPEEKIKLLMMGLPQSYELFEGKDGKINDGKAINENGNNSSNDDKLIKQFGLLRIPSLSKYVKNIDLPTQFDRYVFGINAHKYGSDSKENLMKCAPTYMDQKVALELCREPEILEHITNPSYPHFSVFECHYDAPHCTAIAKLGVSTTFWIFIDYVFGKTVILSASFGDIYIDVNEQISFFGQPPLECESKKWHMITLTATDWTFQQRQIVCYFDSVKINETSGEIGSTVTFGSESENYGIYYLSASFQTNDTTLTNLEVKQIFKNGPSVFCPTSIKMKPGFKYVPYKGIAKYIERLGGQEFIFIQMKNADNSEDLLKLVRAAFNMLQLGIINENFFFSSLRYIIILKKEFFAADKNNIFESTITNELDKDEELKWVYSMRLFSDYNIISENNTLNLDLIPKIIECSLDDSSQLFHFLIDSFVVFKLTSKIQENVLKAINIYVNANPFTLNKLLLVISSLSHIESSDKMSLDDENAKEKQNILFQIIVDHMDLFTQQIKFEHAMIYISTIRDEIALDLLQLIAKISIINPTYFDVDVFKKFTPLLVILAKYQKLWQTLLIFYTSQSADLIEDFADVEVFRPIMTDLILDLLAYAIRFEISTGVKEPFSFQVVKVIVKLLASSPSATLSLSVPNNSTTVNDNLFLDYVDQIQRLAILGFDQETPCPIPFSTEEDVIPPKFINKIVNWPKNNSSKNEIVLQSGGTNKLTRIHALDPSMFEETCDFLSNFETPQIDDYNEEYPLPDNFDDYAKSDTVQIIANLVANVFIQKCNSGGINNKLLAMFLIYGSDVVPKVAEVMHRKIVFAIFAGTNPSLNDENYDTFVKFVTNRVFEGWWKDEIFILFQASFLRKTKSTKQLVIACIASSSNADDQIRIFKELCTSSSFVNDYMKDQGFFNIYVQLIGRCEITNSTLFPDLRNELLEVLSHSNSATQPMKTLMEALQNNLLLGYAEKINSDEQNFSFYNEMKKLANSDSKTIRSLRVDLTKMPLYQTYMRYQNTRLGTALYVRRAFRFQFFKRFNTSNLEIETAISSIFQREVHVKYTEKPSEKEMIVPSPHPLCVPQKMNPLVYDFPIPNGKLVGGHSEIPQSTHQHLYPTKLSELNEPHLAPKCYEGWSLPSFVNISLGSLLLSFFNATSNLFGCSILMNPEALPGIAAFNNEYFSILLNANLNDDSELVLNETSEMLCHFAVIESAAHGIYGQSKLFLHHSVISFKFADILIAIPRRCVYQNTEIDLYFVTGLHLTLIMKEADRKTLLSHVKQSNKPVSSFGPFYANSLLNRPIEKVTKLWQHSDITTYDYLLYLNAVSGRSFNDFSQYPVFPWVLGEFNAPHPVLKRELSKPMGAQTTAREQRFVLTYNETEPHCHYGTHYSHPAAVLHYMMRCEPFTLYNLHLHGGMDHRDRQFSSIIEAWRSASESNLSDLKELIPEFYTMPLMLENPNNIDFQCRTDGTSLNTVILPSWATNNSFQFVWQMRISLESAETCSKIGNWIDLIFGYKQKGQAAVDAINVFQPLTYDTSFNNPDNALTPEQKKAMIDAINQFGQCPQQLFTSPHPECERTIRKTIVNTKFLVTQLINFPENCETIQFHKDMMPYAMPKYEHYVGPYSFQLAKIWDCYINISKTLIDSVDQCSATCVSKDKLILAAASRLGVIVVLSCINGLLSKVNRLISSSFEISAMAVSTQHAMLCAVSRRHIYLFDYTTGFLIKKVSTEDESNNSLSSNSINNNVSNNIAGINNINNNVNISINSNNYSNRLFEELLRVEFDDSSNFIVTISKSKLSIYGLDLRLIVRSDVFEPSFTCISTPESSFWYDRPIYITGHADGSVYSWRADILKSKLFPTVIMQNTKTAITSVSLFSNDRAVIAVDANGTSYLASIVPIHDNFISARAFDKCRICQSSIKGGIGYRCMTCGLYICRQCIASKRPIVCTVCKTKFSSDNIDEDKSSSMLLSSSLEEEEEKEEEKESGSIPAVESFPTITFVEDEKTAMSPQQRKISFSLQQHEQSQQLQKLPEFGMMNYSNSNFYNNSNAIGKIDRKRRMSYNSRKLVNMIGSEIEKVDMERTEEITNENGNQNVNVNEIVNDNEKEERKEDVENDDDEDDEIGTTTLRYRGDNSSIKFQNIRVPCSFPVSLHRNSI